MSFQLVLGVIVCVILSISTANGIPQCACPRQYAPVCGSDGQVYSNRCLLDCTKSIMRSEITVTKEGPCDPAPAQALTTQCPCTRSVSPVCGTDGVTYSNLCLLRCASLKNHELEMQEQGPCNAAVMRNKRSMLYENRYNLHRNDPCGFY